MLLNCTYVFKNLYTSVCGFVWCVCERESVRVYNLREQTITKIQKYFQFPITGFNYYRLPKVKIKVIYLTYFYNDIYIYIWPSGVCVIV